VIAATTVDGCFLPSSLDVPLSQGRSLRAFTLADILGEDDAAHSAAEARVALRPVVRTLEARDQRILYLRFFEDRTQQEIADDIGVTQMQVSRILKKILRDLRSQLRRNDEDDGVVAARAS
jgi:RNA polymerase sigma-B factor